MPTLNNKINAISKNNSTVSRSRKNPQKQQNKSKIKFTMGLGRVLSTSGGPIKTLGKEHKQNNAGNDNDVDNNNNNNALDDDDSDDAEELYVDHDHDFGIDSPSSDNFSQTSDVGTGEQKMQLDDVISEEGLSIGNEYKKTSGGDRKQPSTQIVYHPDDG